MSGNEPHAEWNEPETVGTSPFAQQQGGRLRIVRQPLFSLGDAIAAVVILVMVCGPLALGALGL